MNCLTFKKGFDSRRELEGEMLEHLESCESCRSLAEEERELNELFSMLPTTTAPNDFVMSVRSRIRNGRSPVSGLWAGARIVIPAAAMVFIIGFVMFNSDLFESTQTERDANVIDLATEKGAESIAGSPEPETEIGTDVGVEPRQGTEIDSAQVAKKKDDGRIPRKRDSELVGVDPEREVREPAEASGGTLDSRDEAFEEADSAHPPGLDPKRKLNTRPRAPSAKFTTTGILKTLGVESVWKEGRLLVVSVVRKSAGWRSGLKVGDEIHSIDGNPVKEGVALLGSAKGERIHVIRDGRKIALTIGAKR